MKWNVFKKYVPHVLAIQRIFDEGMPLVVPFIGLAELFRDGGSEAILNRLDCEEERMRVDIRIAAALLIQHFGISHRAEFGDRYGKILELREQQASQATPGTLTYEDDVTRCNALADHGNTLLQFNKYQEAEETFTKCQEQSQC
ncbi:hypothetical protein BDZ45DRAFT_748304 [Acephala macrosclerotiorum]|nr:hypothetical protein BDZ45DRAFT_748304 [Acephala macrosclerotiorum]